MNQTIAQQIKWDFDTNDDLEIKDKNGNQIYWENSDRDWIKREWDSKSKGNRIYYEDSAGTIIDNRPKPSPELTLESLAEDVLKLSELITKFVNQVNNSK